MRIRVAAIGYLGRALKAAPLKESLREKLFWRLEADFSDHWQVRDQFPEIKD